MCLKCINGATVNYCGLIITGVEMSIPEPPQPPDPRDHSQPTQAPNWWRGESNAFLQGSAPELSDLPRERRWKAWRYKVMWTAAASALTLIAGLITAEVVNSNTPSKRRELQAEEEARKEIRAETPPLTTNVRYIGPWEVWETIDSFYVVFDEPFSKSDSNELRGLSLHNQATWDRLHELFDGYAGRPAIETDYSINDSNNKTEFGYSHPFYLDISSEWDSQVQIVDMQAEEECEKSSAKSLLLIPADGSYSVKEVVFALQGLDTPSAVIPRNEAEGERGGEPYFRHETITVGGTEPPVTLNVNGAARKDWRCEWKIHATYNAEGKKSQPAVIDDDGKPLIAEGIPANPVQEWVIDPHRARIVNCITHPRDSEYCLHGL